METYFELMEKVVSTWIPLAWTNVNDIIRDYNVSTKLNEMSLLLHNSEANYQL